VTPDGQRTVSASVDNTVKVWDLETGEVLATLTCDVILEMKINEARQEEVEIEELLDFSENLLVNAAGAWDRSPLEQKQRLQQVLFPKGVMYADGIYRTTATSLMFSMLHTIAGEKEELVALPGIEPGFED
jgi:hypothetical protein